ncbi:MAG: ribosome biogenesis GTP-binding protein YihA/YsxC [Erysipelotrichaceae bacterium]|jgi:GTP-binding protein|nr:ribosome biogenesis GTP-binding protein YihA/YsxC [Erysipelotrichaceae bacterium]
MKTQQAEFVTSAAEPAHWPLFNTPEIVLVGRSNAGKSSLINALTNRNRLAYSGKMPGVTRMINFYRINESLSLADTPGYGYAKRSKADGIRFLADLKNYLAKRENLVAVLWILDIRRDIVAEDQELFAVLKRRNIALLPVLTKSDKLSKSQCLLRVKSLAAQLACSPQDLLVTSALNKTGMSEVWQAVENCLPK